MTFATLDLVVVAAGCGGFAALMWTRRGRAAAMRLYIEPCLRAVTGRHRPSAARIEALENEIGNGHEHRA